MAGSADDMQNIVCPACGEANPPDVARCQSCGAALYGEDPTDDDPLQDLRAYFEDETEPSRLPTNPLRKPQTDFSFGQRFRKEADEPEDTLPDIGIPDWLDHTAAPEKASPVGESRPDWLPEPTAPTPGEVAEGIPDWLSAYADPETPIAGEPAPEGDVPDWLAESGGDELMEGMPAAPSADEGAPPVSEVSPTQEPAPEPAWDAESPAWLDELAELGEAEPEGEMTEPATPPSAGEGIPPPLVDAGPPDWLTRIAEADAEPQGAPPPAPEAADEAAAEPEATPTGLDWLEEFVAEGEPTALEPPVEGEEATTGLTTAPEDLAWLEEFIAEEEPAAFESPVEGEEAGAGPEAASDDLAWLEEFVAEEEPAEADAGPEAPSTLPPDLEPEADAELQPEAAAPAPEDIPEPLIEEDDDTFDWLATLDGEEGFELPPDESLAPAGGEDLLGLSGDLEPAEPGEAEGIAFAEEEEVAKLGEMPEWIASLQEPDEEGPTGEEEPEPTPEETLAGQIADLRYERITGEPREAGGESPETVGALRDVMGAIQPEMIFEGMELTVEAPVEAPVVTGEEAARIALVEELLAAEAEPVSVGDVERGGLPIIRWIAALVLIAAVAVPLVTDRTYFTHAGAGDGVRPAFETLDALADGPATVLAAFEYGPETAAELEPLASALLAHLAGGEDVTVLAVSTKPTGPAMAQAVLAAPEIAPRLAAQGGWANLGYVAGEASGISTLALGPPPRVDSPLAADYRGEPTGMPATSLAGGDFDLVLVFAAQPEDLRAWVEQAGGPTGVPLLAGMSVRAAPFALPYEQSGQVIAVLSGVNDAVAYGALAGGSPPERTIATWNAQALGGAAAAVLIVAGGIVVAVLPRRRRPEDRR